MSASTKTKSSAMSDLTRGNLWRTLLIFALPLFISSLVQQLYSAVDLMFVGQFLGSGPSAAVGSGSLVLSCVINSFIGLSMGGGVLSALYFGAGEEDRLERVIHNAIFISLACGMLISLLGIIFTPAILRLLNTPESVFADAVHYTRICFGAMLVTALFNTSAGLMRSLGDSRTPMLAQVLGGIMNIVLDALFIGLLPMGVAGAAWATVLSQGAACILMTRQLFLLPEAYRLRLDGLRPQWAVCRRLLVLGIPAAIQTMMIWLSNLVMQYYINGMEVDIIAAFSYYMKLEGFMYLPILAYGQAAATFIGQNFGAGLLRRARKGMWACIAMGLTATTLLIILSCLGADLLVGMFTTEQKVISIGSEILRTIFPFYVLYVFLEVFANAIRGAGHAAVPMAVALANQFFLRILLLPVTMQWWPGWLGVAIVFPITWVTTTACLCIYLLFNRILDGEDRTRGAV